MIVTTRDAVYIDRESLCDGRKGIVMFPCEAGVVVRIVDAKPIRQASDSIEVVDALLSGDKRIAHADDAKLVGAIIPPDLLEYTGNSLWWYNVTNGGRNMRGYLCGILTYFARRVFVENEITITKHVVYCPTHKSESNLYRLNDLESAKALELSPKDGKAHRTCTPEEALARFMGDNVDEALLCAATSGWSPTREHIEAAKEFVRRHVRGSERRHPFGVLLGRLDWAITDDDVSFALSTDDGDVLSALAARPDYKPTGDAWRKLLETSPMEIACREDWTPTNEQAEQLIRVSRYGRVCLPLALRLDWSPHPNIIDEGLADREDSIREAWALRLEYIAWKRGQR